MSRKKERQVKIIKHNGVEVPLMFNPNPDHLDFSALLGGRQFSGKDAEKVEREVRKHIDERLQITWIPVIEIRKVGAHYERSFVMDHRMRCRIGFTSDRFYLATIKPGTGYRDCEIVRLEWENYEGKTDAERMHASQGMFGVTPKELAELPMTPAANQVQGEWRTIVAFNPNLWMAMSELASSFINLEDKLSALFTTVEGHAKLINAGAKAQRLLQ